MTGLAQLWTYGSRSVVSCQQQNVTTIARTNTAKTLRYTSTFPTTKQHRQTPLKSKYCPRVLHPANRIYKHWPVTEDQILSGRDQARRGSRCSNCNAFAAPINSNQSKQTSCLWVAVSLNSSFSSWNAPPLSTIKANVNDSPFMTKSQQNF